MKGRIIKGVTMALLGAAPIAANAGIDDGMVLYYNFDQPTAEVVPDQSGSGNYGLIAGTSFEPAGRIGGCFAFNGTGDRVDVVNPYIILPWENPQYSVSLWFLSDSDANFSEGRHMIADNRRYEIAAGLSEGNQVLTSYADSFADCCFGDPIVSTPLAIQQGTWQHVALIVDAFAEPSVRIYLNGELVGTSISSGANYGGYGLTIGAGFDTDLFMPSSYWIGLLDEVRVYNRALSDEEIVELSHPANDGGGGGDCPECEECQECQECEECQVCEECEECEHVQSTVLKVAIGTSADGEGNVTDFAAGSVAFIRYTDTTLNAADANNNVKVSISVKPPTGAPIEVALNLAPQADGSFLGSAALALPAGEAKVQIQGRAGKSEKRRIETFITIH